jgi:hypothetical protein
LRLGLKLSTAHHWSEYFLDQTSISYVISSINLNLNQSANVNLKPWK